MFTIVSRIIRYGFKSFLRNGWLSTATVIIMVLALLASLGLILFRVANQKVIASIQDKVDISVYFAVATEEDDILNLKQSLEELSEIKSVDYISRDEALEIFREQHTTDAIISQALSELDENPLQASLRIKAEKPEYYATIAQYFDNPNIESLVDDVSYRDNRGAIERLTAIINYVNQAGMVMIIVMTGIAGLIVFNTVRLAIYSNRDEIGIMRVVGASNSLVRGPYVIEGVISGFLGALISILITAPIVHFVSPGLNHFIPELNLVYYFYSNLLILLVVQIILGVLIGALSSFIAVRRYLRK